MVEVWKLRGLPGEWVLGNVVDAVNAPCNDPLGPGGHLKLGRSFPYHTNDLLPQAHDSFCLKVLSGLVSILVSMLCSSFSGLCYVWG